MHNNAGIGPIINVHRRKCQPLFTNHGKYDSVFATDQDVCSTTNAYIHTCPIWVCYNIP